MEHLSPLDSAFLRLENPNASLHVASVAIFEGPPATLAEVSDTVRSALPLLPRCRQRLREVPLQLGAPRWVDDPAFDISQHLRRTVLTPPGSEEQFEALVGHLMSTHLRRDRPLWEMHLVDGLDSGHWALVTKMHHSMVDGVAGMNLMEVIFDHGPEHAPRASDAGRPERRPATWRVVSSAVGALPVRTGTLVTTAARVVRDPRAVLGVATTAVRGLVDFTLLALPNGGTTLRGTLGAARAWTPGQVSISDVRTIRSVFGGTLNDVVLAGATRGFREVLLSHEEEPGPHTVRTLIPVSIRSPAHHDREDNEISAVVAELPVHVDGALPRLRAVRAELDRLKVSGEAEAGALVTEVARLVPPPLLAATLTGLLRLPQWILATVVTNVPGPRAPLYLAGRRMLALYPYVPIADRLRLAVAVSSYCDVLYIGVTADRSRRVDAELVRAGIAEEIAELVKAAADR